MSKNVVIYPLFFSTAATDNPPFIDDFPIYTMVFLGMSDCHVGLGDLNF